MTAVHDAAAARLPSGVYLFGGGDGVRQHDEIVEVDPATGRATAVGRLPAPSSDQAGAAIGGTAYVIGGYTGVHWLDTVVAWRPGAPARIVAHLPFPVRYAAVTAVGGELVIAGGRSPTALPATPSSGTSLAAMSIAPRPGSPRRRPTRPLRRWARRRT